MSKQNPNFVATTKSGATYTMLHGRVTIQGSSLPATTFTVYEMYSHAAPTGLPWAGDKTWAEVTVPVIGERFAVVGRDEWRIASAIESIIFINEEDQDDQA